MLHIKSRTTRKISFLLILSTLFLNVSAQNKVPADTITIEGGVFAKVEVEAGFPGGIEGWRSFLMNNLRADVPVKKKAPVGTYMVIVQFIVAKDGEISGIKALTNHGYGMEKEVIRIIKKSPKWLPALQNGRPVNAYRKQPVTFVVTND